MGARDRRGDGALRQWRGLCQSPRDGRRGARPRGLWGELRAPGGPEEQIRPNQLLPRESEHQADDEKRRSHMSVDFGIRLPRFSPDRSEKALAYYERTLDSLSEHITTVWLDDHLQKGDMPFLEA